MVKNLNQTTEKKIQTRGAQILRNEVYMEPRSQACGTACYAQTGDILSKEHSSTAKPVVLCVKAEQYAAVMKDEMDFLRSRHIWIQLTFW